jgi:hypothetical protein
LISASLLWLLRCAFLVAVDLDTVVPYWTDDGLSVQKFVYPVADFWIAATVLGLVTFVLRNPGWSDPGAMPVRVPEQSPQVVMDPGYPHPQYGYQQPAEMYQPPGAYKQPSVYQQPGETYQQSSWMYQQGMYPQPPELSPTPVPANRVYEAGGMQRAAELQGGWAPQPGH